MAEVVIGALPAGDVVGGGNGGGGRDWFGAYGIIIVIVAGIVIPCSIGTIHPHAVLALAPVRFIHVPVCERAAAVVH